MLGLGIGITGALAAVYTTWKSYKRVVDPAECEILRSIVSSGESGAAHLRCSRPIQLLDELRSTKANGDTKVAVLNDALSEVDSLTAVGQMAMTSLSRAAFLAGMAGATAEIAESAGSLRDTAMGAGAAFAVGIIAAGVCTVIGRWAIRDIRFRRQLWDDFVRWILNSQFSRTELNVPGFHCNQADGAGSQETPKLKLGST
jgi:hypothetical protein